MDDHDLMVIRANTDFTYDDRGRMVQSNEPCAAARRPAPRLFLGHTRTGHVVRFGAEVPDALVRRVTSIVAQLPPLADDGLPPSTLDPVRRLLFARAPVPAEGGGPVYRFPATIPRPTEVALLSFANRELVRETFPWLYEELTEWQPSFFEMHDGVAVSVCFSSRWGPLAAEAGVETLPAYRGRGYAGAVTAAWAAAIRASNRIPLYSTAWGNHASRGVARRLRLIPCGSDTTWT